MLSVFTMWGQRDSSVCPLQPLQPKIKFPDFGASHFVTELSEVLLDTDILSEYLKGQDKIVARHAANYARQHGTFTFTSITVHEIVFGLECKGAAVQMERALSWLNKNEQITPTADDYHNAALSRRRQSRGRSLS